ncbi:transglutaminase domain-containing protein [Bifidobacterium pseudolongum]|uniref:transglutaminase domain-containing protein n=1 Tax=Bifidobacterium pseudolongum TaxID=1694 RepID=UPI0010F269F9|nr:transglutaminase domain-containing protein [Bifidobacterium pseudolongum]RYQ11468.1 transglutaminase [Bifidobacterium pseudolongum subsp. globosum]
MTGPQPPYGAPPQQPQQQPQPQQNRLPNQQRPLPQPGWYRHPYTGQTMYWTGTQWSATQPAQPAQSTQAKPVQPGPAKAVAVDARKRRKWIIVASIVAALALVVGVSVPIVRFLERQGIIEVPSLKSMSKEEAYGTTFTADRFDLQDPLIDISNSRKFSMDLESETAQDLAKSEELEACDFLCVYGNANLDAPVEASYDLVDGTRLEITGMSRPDAAQDDNDISKYNLGFSGYEHYWLVQWRDAQGERLAKPKITYFTVKDQYRSPLDRPRDLQLSVDDDGILRIGFSAVEGASKYRLYTIRHSFAGSDVQMMPLADTNQTDVRIDQFAPSTDLDSITECGGFDQAPCSKEQMHDTGNASLRWLLLQSEDDAMECEATKNEAPGCVDYDLGVMLGKDRAEELAQQFNERIDTSQAWVAVSAIDADGHESYLSTASLAPFMGALPVNEAHYMLNRIDEQTNHFTGYASEMPDKLQHAYAKHYVTMLDGRTHEIYKECPKPERNDADMLYSHCTVPGTDYTVEQFYHTVDEYDKSQATIAKWKRSEPRSSVVNATFKSEMNDLIDPDSKPIGKNGVEKYKPFGSTKYVRYIAENLLAGHQMIDIDAYASSPSAPDFYDVLREAVDQNSYLAVMLKVDYSGIVFTDVTVSNKRMVRVTYADDAFALRDAFYDKVMQAASTITAGATREGAVQIDNYLASTAEYDYDAFNAHQAGMNSYKLQNNFPRSWTSGILVDGKGVCASYAYAFDAIADQVGLTSLYVSGQGATGRHAWNRVQLDGKWYDIDATWDDAGSYASSEYQLKDANTLDKHTVESDWMLKSSIPSYGGSQR